MLDWLIKFDQKLFLFLNGLHSPTWDSIMSWITIKESWYPFYVLIIFFIAIKFKKEKWLIFISIAILITLTEQIASGLFKPLIGRLRPCHEPLLEGLVHTINGKCGGQFGYFSAHASNTFGLAGFLYLTFRNNQKYNSIGKIMFFWAAIVSYSRVYVGVHYPLDILSGAICGVIVSYLVYKLYSISINKLLNKH